MGFAAPRTAANFWSGSAATSVSLVSTIGSVNTAPVDARIALGFHGSKFGPATSSASAPAASAVRAIAPRLPGFSMPTATSTRVASAGSARYGASNDAEHALGLGAVGHLGEHPRAHLLGVGPRPFRQQLGSDVDRPRHEPGRERPLHLPRPLGDEQPSPPPLPRLPQPQNVLDARVVRGGDHDLPYLATSGGCHRPGSATRVRRRCNRHRLVAGRRLA